MEARTGLQREPETPGLSFGLEAQGGVGCAVLAKSCLVSGKLSLDSVILPLHCLPQAVAELLPGFTASLGELFPVVGFGGALG